MFWIYPECVDINKIEKALSNEKETLTVKDLREFIDNLPDNMKVYIVSNDEMPVRKLVDISSEIGAGYSELYLDTIEC